MSAGEGTNVTITGNVTGSSSGISTSGGNVTVSGSVTGNGGVDVYNANNATVTIGGDVICGNRHGVFMQDSKGSKVTIDGLLKVPEGASYITLLTVNPFTAFSLKPADHQPTSTKPGYLEYTDGKNYVWIKGEITGTDIIRTSSSTLRVFIKNGCMHVSDLTVMYVSDYRPRNDGIAILALMRY